MVTWIRAATYFVLFCFLISNRKLVKMMLLLFSIKVAELGKLVGECCLFGLLCVSIVTVCQLSPILVARVRYGISS